MVIGKPRQYQACRSVSRSTGTWYIQKLNLIIIEGAEVRASGFVKLSGPRAVHLTDVLKAAPGSEVRVGLLNGACGVGVVTSVAPGTVELRCTFEEGLPERPRVDLLLALPRPKVMRRLWAQIAALGVGQIILTNAERVERNYFDAHVLTPECYRSLLIEGLQQARDTRLPDVSIHRQFRVLVEDDLDGLFSTGRRLVAHPSATKRVSDVVQEGMVERVEGESVVGETIVRESDQRVLLAVGPEGGWNAFEIDLLTAHGFHPAGMGPRTLRTDTACIALLAIVHHAIDPSA